jgi:cathepsin D
MWSGVISIGTPGKSFNVMFDSECPHGFKELHASSTHPILMKAGSADIWVPSSLYTNLDWSSKNKYDASKSSTGVSQGRDVTIKYSGGSEVSGDVYNDTSEALYIS